MLHGGVRRREARHWESVTSSAIASGDGWGAGGVLHACNDDDGEALWEAKCEAGDFAAFMAEWADGDGVRR